MFLYLVQIFGFNATIVQFIKFRFSKKATKFETISHMIWGLPSTCQIKWEIVSNFCGLFRMSELYYDYWRNISWQRRFLKIRLLLRKRFHPVVPNRQYVLPSNHLQQDYEDTRKDIWLENNFGANAHRNLLNLFKKVIRRSTSIL